MLKSIGEFILVVCIFIIAPGIVGNIETHYNREAVVVEVNNDEVVVIDKIGNEWAFYGDGYTVGDTVTMKMFTNYTDNTINDDVIEKVNKKG